jgi:UDP-N-acetylmuramate dehydrogenase
MECLSGIPGTVGAAPIQNIGAYGQELKNTFYSLKAYDSSSEKIVEFNNEDCQFSYRESIFKRPEFKGRYVITEVTFTLNVSEKPQVTYESLSRYLKERNFVNPTLLQVRKSVLEIRKGKFENPQEVGNAGSFFKNPVLASSQLDKIKEKYPDITCYDNGDGTCKVFAGWFIEKAGWKGGRLGNAAVSSKHALVLINPEGKASAKDVKTLANQIIKDVKNKFEIILEPEVQYIEYSKSY